ncbi:MAG: hypothetical protein AB7K24_34810 [Gemmataceae bacterium]
MTREGGGSSTKAWRRCRRIVCAVLAILPLAQGCNAIKLYDKPEPVAGKEKTPGEPVAPNRYSFRASQFLFLSDFEIKKEQPLFRSLADMRDQVYRELKLPESNTLVQVYLFEDRERYEKYMNARYPGLPQRRAFFVAQPRNVGGEDLLVYTYWGDRVREDLRHECTHALLHSVLKDVPLWLDEGLAEYFEMPDDQKGINSQHLAQLKVGGFKPDMDRLERLSKVQQMDPPEYREAWAWVHLMLDGPPEARKVLCAYLQELRHNPNPGPLRPRLAEAVPSLDDRLVQHVARLEVPSKPRAQR